MDAKKSNGTCTKCGKHGEVFISRISKDIMYCRDCLNQMHLSICDF